ncbi:MAG: excinuclease ABC subunit UvrC [Dehalococcoidales bacterium]|nr:excinuclease ABC subunit UvrC [Dehalococcoidales bacterium]
MNTQKLEYIKASVKSFPESPGVYLMKNKGGNIIYVGKASNLRNRVASYFTARNKQNKKNQQLVTHIDSIEYFVTMTEEEALVLELNFIKQYRPHYNIALKDDKSFPYIKIDITQDFPTVTITRRPKNDGARYFGPYGGGVSIRQTLKDIKRIFPFRSCRDVIDGKKIRPCLEFDLGRCLGPCAGKTTRSDYQALIDKLILFLEGRHNIIIRALEQEMKSAADYQEYERAASLRDRINNLKKILTYQEMATKVKGDRDAIAFYRDENETFVQVYFVRSGKITGREGYFLKHTRYETDELVMTSFVKQFYDSAMSIPPVIHLQHPINDRSVIKNWLKTKTGHPVTINVPLKGPKRELIDMVEENARQGLEGMRFKIIHNDTSHMQILEEAAKLLRLPSLPLRIEGYDISNLSGKMAVGSMVVFEKGKPAPSKYRRFRIQTVDGPDDYQMIKEVISRRFKNIDRKDSTDWAVLPDLVLIDGGKGQLHSALSAVPDSITNDVAFISLAEEHEEIFTPGSTRPVAVDKNNPVLHLLQKIRDEAHRFAVTYHRTIRSKQNFSSPLESISGVGPKRKKALLKRFGSMEALKDAAIEQIAGVEGISFELAKKIKDSL